MSKKSGAKGSVAKLENSKQLGCDFQDVEPPNSKSIFTEEQKTLETEAQRALLHRYITPRQILGKKGSIARTHSKV